jgi:hypothetical protein
MFRRASPFSHFPPFSPLEALEKYEDLTPIPDDITTILVKVE